MNSKLITAKHLALRENQNDTRGRLENHRQRFFNIHPKGNPPGGMLDILPVKARIDYGRWLADCECGGAEYVDPEESIFFCNSCGNVMFNGEFRPVIFPDETTRAAIEKVLLARPVDETRGLDPIEKAMLARPSIPGLSRSWDPGESVADLKEQNRRAGLK